MLISVHGCVYIYYMFVVYVCLCVCVGGGGYCGVCSCDALQRNVFPPFKSCFLFCFLLLLFLEEFFTSHLVQTSLIVVG